MRQFERIFLGRSVTMGFDDDANVCWQGQKKVKILWVKPGKLLPLDTGGKLRTYNILRKLADAHELTYLSYYGGQRDETYEREILTHLPGTVSIYTAAPDTTAAERYLDYLRRLTWPAPYAV